ncbi:hypothetical protein SUDANB108_03977 [Streptomyces sp. enrichment culture]|uniref:SCO3374 family protein n=1 Tax=Streptomyces sp. enrichment culture TaxID=1795815 RepID=UPI003F57CD5C
MSGTSPSVPASAPPVTPRPSRDPVRRWYEDGLGWPTAPGDPLRLVLGVRFDVLEVPAEVAPAALRRLAPGSPVAARDDRVQLLVAAGSAEELPALLEWLEWGALPPGLVALGPGASMEAPLPSEPSPRAQSPCSGAASPVLAAGAGSPGLMGAPSAGSAGPGRTRPGVVGVPPSRGAVVPSPRVPGSGTGRPLPLGRLGSQGAAVWLRPPEPGCEAETSLPTLSALGGGAGAPDLVRLVDTVAAQCHRARLRRAGAQPPASRARGR